MALIAIGGIQHETNSFAPTKAGLKAFETGGSRPPDRIFSRGSKARTYRSPGLPNRSKRSITKPML